MQIFQHLEEHEQKILEQQDYQKRTNLYNEKILPLYDSINTRLDGNTHREDSEHVDHINNIMDEIDDHMENNEELSYAEANTLYEQLQSIEKLLDEIDSEP